MPEYPPIAADLFRQWQEQSRLLDQVQIAFIVGPPKCGTTWVMQGLDGHPNAIARGESAVGRALFPNFTAAVQHYNAHQTKFGDHRHTMIGDVDFMCLLRQVMDRQFIQYIATGKKMGTRRLLAVMDKTPAHSQHIDLLSALYPRSKVICCVRDVRDGAVSGWFHFGSTGWIKHRTIEEYARVYAQQTWGPMLRDARRSGARLGPQRYVEIEYARHKSDPKGQMAGLLEFIGLPHAEAEVNACIAAGDFRKASGGRQAGTEDRNSFFRKGVVGDWTNHFSQRAGDEIMALAEAVLSNAQPAAAP